MTDFEPNEKSTLELLKSDLLRARILGRHEGEVKLLELLIAPVYAQFRVLTLVRIATLRRSIFKKIARVLLRSFYKIEIGSNVKIGHSIFFPHPMCIVIGDGALLGDEVSIAQFTTIGGNFRKTKIRDGHIQKLPRIGSKVIIGPGSVIGGPVLIGNSVIIGANSVITKDIPPNSIAYGTSKISRAKIEVDPTGAYSTTICATKEEPPIN